MNARQHGRGSKYADDFKRQLVAESRADGVKVPMVAERHGVPTNRIYAWRGDARFQPDGSAVDEFTPVEVADDPDGPAQPISGILPATRIEITLENGPQAERERRS